MPAVADMPGCREAVSEGENGFLVPARDVPALAAALRTLLEDQDLRRRMGDKSRQRAAAFGVERVIAETLAVYRDLLKQMPKQGTALTSRR